MPVRHGCSRVKEDGPLFLHFGMLGVFIGVLYPGRITSQQAQKRVQSLHLHINDAFRRLAYSLDMFQQAKEKWEDVFSLPMEQWMEHDDQIVLGIAADSIAHYFNICFDDVWRLVPFVFDPVSPDEPGEYKAFKRLLERGKFAAVKPLFDQLRTPGTWWHSMLMRETGIRQRFVHYTDMFSVQGSKGPDDERVQVETFVWKQDSSGQRIDFITILRESLNGFCDWLDKLEAILINELSAQCATRGLAWTPPANCPRVLLPVGMQEGTREIPDDFLYLPVCDGSLPIKGTFTLIIQR
jgi:hypothetical protein